MSASNNNRLETLFDEKKGTVTMTIIRRRADGTVTSKQQFTISRREFERSMVEADMIVPWLQKSSD